MTWTQIFLFFSFAQTQTYEIILTLGQAFEVAYQMAVQSRARHYVPPSSLSSEFIETKTSRPVSQSWNSMRRSAVSSSKHQQTKGKCVHFIVSNCWNGSTYKVRIFYFFLNNIWLWSHNSEKMHRPHDRYFLRHWNPNGPPPTGGVCCVCGRKWWVITLYQIHLACFPSLRVAPMGGDFVFLHTWKVMNEKFYMLLTGRWLISSGIFLGAEPSWLDSLACINSCRPSVMHWCIDISGRI